MTVIIFTSFCETDDKCHDDIFTDTVIMVTLDHFTSGRMEYVLHITLTVAYQDFMLGGINLTKF